MHFWKRSTGSLSPTEFNGRRLIDGTYDLKGFVEKSVNETDATFDTLSVKVESYSDEAKIGIYEIKLETSMKTEMRREIDEDGMAVDVPLYVSLQCNGSRGFSFFHYSGSRERCGTGRSAESENGGFSG